MRKYSTTCRPSMFFNSDKQLSLRFSNIFSIQATWTLKPINDATSVKFIDFIFNNKLIATFFSLDYF